MFACEFLSKFLEAFCQEKGICNSAAFREKVSAGRATDSLLRVSTRTYNVWHFFRQERVGVIKGSTKFCVVCRVSQACAAFLYGKWV